MILRCESEICELQSQAIFGNQDILWLQVSVVYANGVAIGNCIKKLKKCVPDKRFLPSIEGLVRDPGEKVSSGAELENDIRAIRSIYNFKHGDHIGMLADLVVQLNLALLESSLPRLKSDLVECFYSKLETRVVHMYASVDNTICANAQNFD